MTSKYFKIYAFIDSQNLNLGIQSLGWKLDFKKFYIFLKHKFRIEKAYLFLGYIPKYRELYEKLEGYGYTILFKPVTPLRNGKHKGNVDVELVLQAIWYDYNNYEKAIIVSGDGDFYSLYKILKQENKLARICIPNYKSKSKLLDTFNSYTYMLEQNRGKLEKVGRRGPTSRRL
ncbi:NYN domain-containing protein [Candidatus Dojkabacteria bacterium]|nr:NYN domain-containing protein [Candidatus Dojkabacteria bacterium]